MYQWITFIFKSKRVTVSTFFKTAPRWSARSFVFQNIGETCPPFALAHSIIRVPLSINDLNITAAYLFDCASDGFLSLCLLFLNQLLTWVRESPVILARFRFSAGDGYRFRLYISFSAFLDLSLKQYTVSSPSQIVRGSGYFLRKRYLSTAPSGLPRAFSASL